MGFLRLRMFGLVKVIDIVDINMLGASFYFFDKDCVVYVVCLGFSDFTGSVLRWRRPTVHETVK